MLWRLDLHALIDSWGLQNDIERLHKSANFFNIATLSLLPSAAFRHEDFPQIRFFCGPKIYVDIVKGLKDFQSIWIQFSGV